MTDEPRHDDTRNRQRDRVLADDVHTRDVDATVPRSRSGSEPTLRPTSRPATCSDSPSEPAGKPFGRYRLLGELGHGGMGVVWKAWDTQLRRVVALKGLIAGEFAEQAQIERFMREARSAARLSHPGIVPVYDVGEHEGYHYFTTEYIEGRPLDKAMEEPVATRQALEWVKGIAEALHYAHGQGVIHRDVKPGNVLIDAQGLPHVMDFGLAKQIEQGDSGPVLTLSGDLLGTPRYMSPEQTRGAAGVGPASDQFSLGVVLYELLTRRPPFDATSMRELLNAIAERDPKRPTEVNPKIHRDIETICLKALEKDPARRYPSLAAMAADIGAYLAGEPIAARPVSGVARAIRRLSRHKAGVAFASVGVVLGTVALVYALSARARAIERLAKAQTVSKVFGRWSLLSDTLRELEGVSYDASLPLEERRRRAVEPWKRIEEFARETPPDSGSQATMRALVGWARRLAGEEAEGIQEMRDASSVDPDVPYGALLEALALFSAYAEGQELPEIATSEAEVRVGLPIAEDSGLARIRSRMEVLLSKAAEAPVWGTQVAEAFGAAVRGILAMQSARYDEAEQALSEALAAPDLRCFQVGLYLARAEVRYCARRYEAGRKDLEKALEARPRHPALLRLSSDFLAAMAVEAANRGGDPRPLLRRALADAEQALALLPDFDEARVRIGNVRTAIGEAMEARGEDPRGEYRAAIAALEEALARGYRPDLIRLALGSAHYAIGKSEEARGLDPMASYAKAIEYGDAVIRDRPDAAAGFNNRGLARLGRAHAERDRGADPIASFERAISDFSEALKRDPTLVAVWMNRGGAGVDLGNVETDRGQDARSTFDQVIADYTAALTRAPGYFRAWVGRGEARRLRAEAGNTRGEDPHPGYEAALADFAEALSRKPRDPDALGMRATTFLTRANWKGNRGEDSLADLNSAVADLEVALAERPGWFVAHNLMGATCGQLATVQAARSEDCREALRRAIEAFGQAIRCRPDSFQAYGNRARAHTLLAQAEVAHGGDGAGEYDRALSDFAEAIRLNPAHFYAYFQRGIALIERGGLERERGQDARAFFDRAAEDLNAAATKNPSLWQAWFYLGQLSEQLGEPRKAVEAYERAVRIAGDAQIELKQALARARAAAGEK